MEAKTDYASYKLSEHIHHIQLSTDIRQSFTWLCAVCRVVIICPFCFTMVELYEVIKPVKEILCLLCIIASLALLVYRRFLLTRFKPSQATGCK